MTTLDTSAVYALMNRRDPQHARVVEAFDAAGGPYRIPAGILAEIGYMLETRYGPQAVLTFLDDLTEGAFVLDCSDADLPRIRELVERYGDLPLGVADASVVACAERTGGPVITLDQRHFRVVQGERTIDVLP